MHIKGFDVHEGELTEKSNVLVAVGRKSFPDTVLRWFTT